MKAVFISKQGHRVIVEPMEGQTEEQLRKKALQIMKKRNINSELTIEIFDICSWTTVQKLLNI